MSDKEINECETIANNNQSKAKLMVQSWIKQTLLEDRNLAVDNLTKRVEMLLDEKDASQREQILSTTILAHMDAIRPLLAEWSTLNEQRERNNRDEREDL